MVTLISLFPPVAAKHCTATTVNSPQVFTGLDLPTICGCEGPFLVYALLAIDTGYGYSDPHKTSRHLNTSGYISVFIVAKSNSVVFPFTC